jgi:hypothetical protein
MIKTLVKESSHVIISIDLVDDHGGIHEEVFAKQISIAIRECGEHKLYLRSITYFRDNWILVFTI